jgi:hypothetical protein
MTKCNEKLKEEMFSLKQQEKTVREISKIKNVSKSLVSYQPKKLNDFALTKRKIESGR